MKLHVTPDLAAADLPVGAVVVHFEAVLDGDGVQIGVRSRAYVRSANETWEPLASSMAEIEPDSGTAVAKLARQLLSAD